MASSSTCSAKAMVSANHERPKPDAVGTVCAWRPPRSHCLPRQVVEQELSGFRLSAFGLRVPDSFSGNVARRADFCGEETLLA